ncbi:MAG TPA: WD40 repeat domain-containing protein [Acetobacteraceae bacterium]|nr:WD40 repeat domain-containing protein [Acetobacteraceae bacterium]
MGETANADSLLKTRGESRSLEAFVVACAFERSGRFCAFALGDGTLRIAEPAANAEWRSVVVHEGAVLSLAPDAAGGGFLSGGDDGALRRTATAGEVAEIARFGGPRFGGPRFGGQWVEHVASHEEAKAGGGRIAAAVGKSVHLFDGAGLRLKSFEHKSTVNGIAFDAKGKRLAASHYNGVSLWFVGAKEAMPRALEWKGSHLAVALHPDGDAVVTAMQENALHGWRLSDGQHMRMSGYPAKTESLSFSRRGKWLASSGADAIILWPFFGGGPMGKTPLELAGGDGVLCTRVACHPLHDAVAGGFADGLVVLADIDQGRVLPVAAPGRGTVSALAWNADGTRLAFGTESGFAATVDFSRR